jgi:GNAT superfamily N-acetyltransferase
MIRIEEAAAESALELSRQYLSAYAKGQIEKEEHTVRTFIAYLDGKPAGFLAAAKSNGLEFIVYVLTLPEYRGTGVAQALIREASGTADYALSASFSDAHEYAPELMHILEKLDFKKQRTKYNFRCYGDDLWDRWDAYMEKSGRRMCDTLRRQGYSTVTLADASEELLDQFRHSYESEYHNVLNHQHLIMPGAEITKDVSVLCVRNGKLSAYVFAYMPEKYSAVFKTLSSSEALHGSGVILLPLAESFRKVREKGCVQFMFSMDGIGARANSFRNKVLGHVITKRTMRYTYTYSPEKGMA